MSTIDERVVQMKFQNAQFQQGVQQTIASLQQLNKSLQLQGATKGLAGVSTAAQQFDQHVTKSRNTLGQFTQSVTQSSTSAQGFSQKVEAGKQHISQFGEKLGTAVTKAQEFGQKVETGRDALGRFTSNLSGTSSAADKTSSSLKNIENSTSSLANRFSTLGSIATGALMNIGARAQEAGMQFANSFTFGPIMDGFREYELNMNSIQTILANTQAAGTTLKDVTAALDELNTYSDQTIYNFAEMAKNIGTFTAAGVDLDSSTAAIKGIANLAAISGSNSEQASGAMYQLSQALSAGRVTLEDWNSVVNAGMGGTVFQRALAQNAVKLGTLNDGAVKLSGSMKNVTIEGKSFRESISAANGQESWLTSKVLTQTLSQFTGDLKDADLAAQGFSKSQIKAIQEQAKMAQAAATEVKTLTQLFGTFKEQMGSGWSNTWKIIFGDFQEAKGLFTGISNSVGKMLEESADARNKMLKDWDALGGRTAVIDGITNVFQALGSVLKPIKDAFREIFPATTGKQLADMSKSFRDFTERLKIGGETADKLKRTFAGVFAVFGIAVDIIKGVVGVIGDLLGVVFKGSGGFLDFTAKIGDFLVALRKGIQQGEGLTHFFEGLGSVLAIPIKLVQKLAGFLASLFKDTKSKNVEKSVEGISKKLEPLGRLGDVASAAWEKTLTVLENVGSFFKKVGSEIGEFFGGIGIDISSMFDGLDFDKVFAGINTGLFAGLVMIIKNFAGGGPQGLFDGIIESVENFAGVLGSMQNTLRAATLLQIALAVGILAASMNVLSKIDADGLTRASVAMAGLFTQLLASLLIFEKLSGFKGFAKMPFVAASMILLSTAVLILASAVEKLSALDWNELAKGLTGTTVLLAALVGVSRYMKNPAGLISTAFGMIVLAGAVKLLASSVESLSELGWNELAKGLVGVGTLLGALTLFTMFAKVNKGGLAQGAGIILLATGIKILASAVEDFSKMSWHEIGKGLTALAGGMVAISAALKLIPKTGVAAGAGVLLIALSLGKVAEAMEDMAQMGWEEIGKGTTAMLGALGVMAGALYIIPKSAPIAAAGILVTAIALEQVTKVLARMAEFSWEDIGKAMTVLAGSLALITGALYLITGALPGAAALLVVSAALWVLHPVLVAFSEMTWEEIAKGLVMLAGALTVIGLAGYILAPIVPAILGLGAGVALLGVGMMAAGAGVLLFATALTALAAAGAAATAAIIGIVAGLVGLIPEVFKQIGLGVVAFAEVIAVSGPQILKAMVTVLESLIKAIVRLTPKIVDALLKLLLMLLRKLEEYVPKMVDAGLKLLAGLLKGIADNIGRVATQATRVVTEFLKAIGKNLPKVVDAGFKMIIQVIRGVREAIDANAETLGREGGKLAVAIVRGMVKGIDAGLGEIRAAAGRLALNALKSAKEKLGIHSPSKEFEKVGKFVNDGFRKGLDGNKDQVYGAFNDLKQMLKDTRKSAAEDIKQLEEKLKKLNSARKKDWAAIKKTRVALAQARKEFNAYTNAYSELTKKLNDEKGQLGKLADKYDVLSEKIKKAQDAYDNAIKTRDDYRTAVREQYSDIASATGDISVADYLTNLNKQVEDTKKFATAMQRLRAFGINDEMYKDLLATGTSALPFVEELLNNGLGDINKINELNKQLDSVGATLGKNASDNLYQAGVQSAKGFLDGLKGAQKALEKQMDKIADAMVKAIKKKLGIKSPSRVFMEIGGYSAKGLIQGLDGMSGSVAKAASSSGDAAKEALRKSMSGMSDIISQDMNMAPVITPVLDLSLVRKDAGQIGSLVASNPLSVDSSYDRARFVSKKIQAIRSEVETQEASNPTSSYSYTQNNYSPKALSSVEIYRNTKNQLSTMRGALATSAGTS